jgi:hypothetical protein
MAEYPTFEKEFVDSNERTFDIFALTEKIGRERVLPLATIHMILEHHLDIYINDRKLSTFLNEI